MYGFDRFRQVRWLGIEPDSCTQMWQSGSDRVDLADIRCALGENSSCAAAFERVLNLGDRAGWIHADGNATDTQDGECGHDPLSAGRRHDGHPVARRHPEIMEAQCRLPPFLQVLAPAGRAVIAVHPTAECDRL